MGSQGACSEANPFAILTTSTNVKSLLPELIKLKLMPIFELTLSVNGVTLTLTDCVVFPRPCSYPSPGHIRI